MSDKNQVYHGLVTRSKGGVSKKGRDYTLLELTIIEVAANVTIFGDAHEYDNVKQGDVVDVSIDTSNPMEAKCHFIGLSKLKTVRLE